MRFVFWFSLAGVLYTYAGYPVIMLMLSRLRPRPWKKAAITPSVSIVLAVHNGAALIGAKIQQLLGLSYPQLKEIIVVSDGSDDGTSEVLGRTWDTRFHPVVLKEHGGKAVALNAGMERATGDVLVFIDVRPEIAPLAIEHLVSNFADPRVGCVAGELRLRQDGHDAGSGAVSGVYWRYEQWLRTREAIFDSPVGVYGGFYAVRRELAVRQPPGIILDDMFQPLSIIKKGYRSVVDVEALVYDVWPNKVEGEFQRKIRTLAGNFQLFQLAPWTLGPENRVVFQLFSHKVMRLLVPYLLMLALTSSIILARGSGFYTAMAVLQIVVWLLGFAAEAVRVPILRPIASAANGLLVLNAAAVVGLHKFLFTRGPLWKIWRATPTTGIKLGSEVEATRR